MIVNSYRLRNGNFPPTAIALAAALNAELVSIGNPQPPAVNWGYRLGRIIPGVLNSAAPIEKLTAFRRLREAGVSSPEFEELGSRIVRRYRHSQGRDILTADDAFLVQRLEKLREVRIDVYRSAEGEYRAFRLHTKTPNNPGEFVWNRNNVTWQSYGYQSFTRILGDRVPIDLAKSALQALRYDFGAVDLLQDTNRRWYVLEVNSDPNLGDTGVEQYARRLQPIMVA